jgi:hypothetical protein
MGKTILYEVAADGDVRAYLAGNTLRRTLSIGSNWTRLRIGIRFSYEDTGATLTGTPRFVLGLCSGTANPWNNGASTTLNFIGVRQVNASVTRNIVGDSTHFAGALQPFKRLGITSTTGTTFTNAWVGSAQPATRRNLLFLDILKGSPNYTLHGFYRDSTVGADVTRAKFIEQVEVVSSVVSNHSWTDGGPLGAGKTLAFDEVAGALDTVNIAWDRSAPKIYISDLAIVRQQ